MAPPTNTFVTSAQISKVGIDLLTRSLVLPMTSTRVPGGEFAGGSGDTVTVRLRSTRTAKNQATAGAAISFEDLAEDTVDVTVTNLYDAARVTDYDLTLNISDYAAQVTAPQVEAVARGAEDQAADALNGVTATGQFALSESAEDTEDVVIAAAQALDEANVPSGNRFLAVSPGIKSRLLKVVNRYDKAGDASALRQAVIGDLYGFTVVVSNAIAAGTAVAYHRSGLAFANFTPKAPRGAADSATATQDGVSMRHIHQYMPANLVDASIVSTFAGAKIVEAARAYGIDTSTTA